ncbi:Luciferase-like monooxygenase [Xylanimonas cellulosilytica DSM 15894]|uniref:Luciferase-like monooxygenase n=1 Tax=Xylanimonas cellulosilytica (strain DSM 15894 / JCM 12276 / CECT 5975 / KCTC 9989 / LMG 20990 / NBRC 107835 / XIL07) TaxID=446471 RepID=D1BZA8_XYLCX|nr:LLM class flavin-dependent oxidoreductase [Xylanimonas cellulosilytica]ACZ32005.1 Luciferase-like monooxygenase [Xylanimonas cellulosilytica DSM 15894]
MKLSLWPNSTDPVADILAEARAADADGWHGVWLADHYMPNTGDLTRADGPMHEVWGLLPAVAAVTSRVRIGPLVSPTTIHHPALLAKRASAVDHVSDGRFVLGVGAGWQRNEHDAYGFELPGPRVLVDRFGEALQITRSMLDEKRTTFHGEHFTVDDAPAEPKPVQARLPILVGGKGPRMLRLTARFAQEWNTWGLPEPAGAVRRRLLDAAEQVGRTDPLWTTTNWMLDLDGETPSSGRVVTGSRTELQDLAGAWAEQGFDEFILPTWNLGATTAERQDRAARLKAEVFAPFLG